MLSSCTEPSPGSGIRLRTSQITRRVGASTTCQAIGKLVIVFPGNDVIVLTTHDLIASRPVNVPKACSS